MKEDLLKIKKLLVKYIGIIIKEYPTCCGSSIIEKVNHGEELVKFNKSTAISFFVKNDILLLPQSAYNIFLKLKKYENYGTKPNAHRNIEDYLDTATTYKEYIDHIIEGALSVYDYFEESLLHEAMHICGSQGGTPLEEGINELKTRELAQKYNIRIAAYGYSKEVEVAKYLQRLVGKEIMDELTFIPKNERKIFLSDKAGVKIAELYELLSRTMIEKTKDYYSRLPELNNPFEKAELYESINYSELYKTMDDYY